MFSTVNELEIGNIVEVSGTNIRVEISRDISELTQTYQGRVYPIGQIGSFIKIHYGRKVLFGIVTLLRMRSELDGEANEKVAPESDQRVMDVQLIAEGYWNPREEKLAFKRGIKTYPLPQQKAYLLLTDEIKELYRSAEGSFDDQSQLVRIGRYSASDTTACRANIDKMFGMHCAVLGSTGAGKSGTVAAVVHSVLEHKVGDNELSPQIIMIDPHGEYGEAFGDRAVTFQAYEQPHVTSAGKTIVLPYWLMNSEEFGNLITGKPESGAAKQNAVIYKALTHARLVQAGIVKAAPDAWGEHEVCGLEDLQDPLFQGNHQMSDILSFNIDQPRPFCLEEFENHIRFIQGGEVKSGSLKPKATSKLSTESITPVLDKFKTLKQDKRLKFILENWEPKKNITLSGVINQFVGKMESEGQDIRVVDISGLPNEIAGPLTALMSRLLFQYKVHQTGDEREKDPVLFVCEEAHRYVPDRGDAQYSAAQGAIRRIAKEGRKYGIGLMLVSQRPSDIDSTVLSQCGTWLVMRLTNGTDHSHVSRFLPDGLSGMVDILSTLSQQEAIFVGEGAALPSRITLRHLTDNQLPKSKNIGFAKGWSKERMKTSEIDKVTARMVD